MKTFEEKWTAWLDGELNGKELAEFEASLPDRAAAEIEKAGAQKLRVFLKEHLVVQPMGNDEFFHHQLRKRIEQDSGPVEGDEIVVEGRTPWSIGRLVWAGAASLAIFALCTFFVLRDKNPVDQSTYLSQILNARVDPVVSPNATISIFEAKDDKVTVLWVDGLQSLPSEYATK